GSSWEVYTDGTASQGSAVRAIPNTGVLTRGNANGPRLDYEVDFTTLGTYRLWVRLGAPSSNDNSIHAGLDGVSVTATASNSKGMETNGGFAWTDQHNGSQFVDLVVSTPGVHTINLWMREDGVLVDKIIMQITPSTPTGEGPPATPTGNCVGGPGTIMNQPPVASFSANGGSTPLEFNFDATSSYDPDGIITSYAWDFGDGNTGTGVSVMHTYATTGTYNVSLTITDDSMATDIATESIDVQFTTSVDAQISGSSDDVEEKNDTGNVDMNSSDIELGEDGPSQTVGLMFRNINIPQGAVITSAYLEFTVDEADSGPTVVDIYAENTDNSSDFTTANSSVSSRSLTSASTNWNIPAWNTIGSVHQSPDISAVVQEVINRPGWAANNKLSFIITGSGSRTAESYDGDAQAAAKLHIEFGAPGSSFAPRFAQNSGTVNTLEKIDFKVYPVPTSDRLTIEFNSDVQMVQNIRIIDMVGREVKMIENPDSKVLKIDISNLNVGMYMIQSISGNQVVSKPFTIVR
ncbi:MAG: PKD domain-containing protein, partial [Bacteroidetes bacterium]|nr:PKD domain-containing protein [Bacteroidota bacterium]